MIRFIEITPPNEAIFRQAKIVSFAVNEGSYIKAGEALFIVKSAGKEYPLPAPNDGRVVEFIVNPGDPIHANSTLLLLETGADDNLDIANAPTKKEKAAKKKANHKKSTKKKQTNNAKKQHPSRFDVLNSDEHSTHTNDQNRLDKRVSDMTEITIPDLGGADAVEVIDILVKVGDSIVTDDALMTVESDKASMDIPASISGTVASILVKIGDSVTEGDAILKLANDGSNPKENDTKSTSTTSNEAPPSSKTEASKTKKKAPATKDPKAEVTVETTIKTTPNQQTTTKKSEQQSKPNTPETYHASPSVRRFARELGVDLNRVQGTNRKNRISKDDVKGFVKGFINNGSQMSIATNNTAGIPAIPTQDFSKFGEIEVIALNKIKRVTASHLHRSWLNIPHVTHHDESNISDLEEFRKTLNVEYAKREEDIKLSVLAFIVKAVISALKTYPQFNSSLENGGENLVLKNYYNIGIAVETPNGLVVPVIRDADALSIAEIAQTMSELAKKARDGELTTNDISGGSFTISSLGGIGGTHFTPIVNAPEVAILGVSRTKIQAVWNGSEFIPAPTLPLNLSYDHRVIDGAEAARFTRHIALVLEDLRRLTL